MPSRTAEEFLDGLRDGRAVYVAGRLVPDVTEHASLAIVAGHAANVYELAEAAGTRDLFTVELDGDVVSHYDEPLRSAEALDPRTGSPEPSLAPVVDAALGAPTAPRQQPTPSSRGG